MPSSLIMEFLITWFSAAEEYVSECDGADLDRGDNQFTQKLPSSNETKLENHRIIFYFLTFMLTMNVHRESRFTWTFYKTNLAHILSAFHVFTLNMPFSVPYPL